MQLISSSSKRLIGAAVLAGAAALGPLAALAATASPAAAVQPGLAATPRCAASGLVIWLDTDGNGAAGSTFYNLHFTNLSGRTCTLFGYPGVSAVNLAGRQLGRAASRDSSRRPRTIRLANRATATTTLRIVDAGNFVSTSCSPVTAAGLRVFPPNGAASKLVPFPFAACSRIGPAFLTVRAVR